MIWLNENLTAILTDIGLSKDEINLAQKLSDAGQNDELQKRLRLCRCDLMDEMHITQRKVDNLDYLLRQFKGGTSS